MWMHYCERKNPINFDRGQRSSGFTGSQSGCWNLKVMNTWLDSYPLDNYGTPGQLPPVNMRLFRGDICLGGIKPGVNVRGYLSGGNCPVTVI